MKIFQKLQNYHVNLMENFISKLKFSLSQLLIFLRYWRKQATIPLLWFLTLQTTLLLWLWSLSHWHWIGTINLGCRVQFLAPLSLYICSLIRLALPTPPLAFFNFLKIFVSTHLMTFFKALSWHIWRLYVCHLIHYVRTIIHQELVEIKFCSSLLCLFSFCLMFVYLCGCACALVWGFKFGCYVFFCWFWEVKDFASLLPFTHMATIDITARAKV